MTKILFRFYNYLLKNTSTSATGLISQRDLNIWKALKNKQVRDFSLNKLQDKILITPLNVEKVETLDNNMLFIKNTTPEKYFIDKNGFTSLKLMKHEIDKQIVQESIKMGVAHHSTILTMLTKNTPLTVSGKSGIYAPPETLYQDVTMSLKLCQIMSKFVITVLGGDIIKDEKDFILRIETFLNTSDLFEDMYNFYPIVQHMVNSLMANFKFNPALLYSITGKFIDYSFYMNNLISISLIIEACVVKKTLLSMLEKHDFLYAIAQNPDNPKGDHTSYAGLAYKLMKQPHPDFRVENLLTHKILFFDVKLRGDMIKNIPTLKGVLTLVPAFSHKDMLEYIRKTRADLGNIITFSKDIIQIKIIMQQIKKIKELETNKKLTPSEKYQIFDDILNEIDLNPQIVSAIGSRVTKAPIDWYFNKIYKENPEIQYKLKILADQVKLTDLISRQGEGHQIANVDQWKELSLKVIAIMPEHLKPIIYKNLLTYYSFEQ